MRYWRWEKYFTPDEVLSPIGLAEYERGNLLILPEFLDLLYRFRQEVNAPLYVNKAGNLTISKFRGYRSPLENRAAGGVALSRHIQGVAADITCPEMSTKVLYHRAINFGFGGVGLYQKGRFVHIDMRPQLEGEPTVWNG